MYIATTEFLPPGGKSGPGGAWGAPNKGTFMVFILPYMEQVALYSKVDWSKVEDQGTDIIAPTPLSNTRLPYAHCPSDQVYTMNGEVSNYIASIGPSGGVTYGSCPDAFNITLSPNPYPGIAYPNWFGQDCVDINPGPPNPPGIPIRHPERTPGLFSMYDVGFQLKDILDGTSNTIMLGATLPIEHRFYHDNSWAGYNGIGRGCTTIIPINTFTPTQTSSCTGPDGPLVMGNWGASVGFKSKHPGGANFVFADGSVHFLSEKVSMLTYQKLGCRNDGQTVGDY